MSTPQKNSEQYLNKILGKATGFKVPKGYFDTVEEAVFTKQATEKFNSNTGFITPEKYLDTLEDKVLASVVSKEKQAKIIPLRTLMARFASISAAACVLVFIGIQFFDVSEQNTLDNIAIEDVELWMNTHINQIENTELVSAFETTDLETTIVTEGLTDEAIENYLNTLDPSTIINEIN